jgi:hypothetical protein
VIGLLVVVATLLVTTSASDEGAEAATSLPAPTGLTLAVRSDDSVDVHWRARARGATRHEVRTSPSTRTYKVGRSRSSVRLRGLRSGRRYRVLVRACRGTRCGRSVSRTVLVGARSFSGVPTVGGCPVFPADDPWNRDVSDDPVDPRSDEYLRSIGVDDNLHPDFGSGRFGDYGIPFSVVPAGQALVPIRFVAYGDESDPGPYPVPRDARIEGGANADGDRHVLVVRQGECKLYELYRAIPDGSGWRADSGAVFDLRDPRPRPAGWTSADAAGLPILPGLARPDEASAGRIRHALRFTVAKTQRGYVAPARHFASSSTDRSLPPMGLRLRLRSDFDRSRFTGQSRAILDALARYGMIVADNGSDWFITGSADPRWDDEDLEQLKRVPGRAFEVVRSGPITTK